MSYVVYTIAIVYGLLHGVAAMAKSKQSGFDTAAWLMLAGSALMICAPFARSFGFVAVLVGGALVCIAAMLNGRNSGNFHTLHHVVRISLTALIAVGFALI